MTTEKLVVSQDGPQIKTLYRIGGTSGILIGVLYVVITLLYVLGGLLPDDSEEKLKYLAAHTLQWWGILWLSVLTDFLFILVAWSLYVALKDIDRNTMLMGAGLIVVFVILDLAITWPNYSVLITLSGKYTNAIDEVDRQSLIGAASYTAEVLSSRLLGSYIILVPSIGIFMIGMVMMKGIFNKATAYLGLITGILGTISVVGAFFVEAIGTAAIATSIFTTIWVLLVGFRLWRL